MARCQMSCPCEGALMEIGSRMPRSHEACSPARLRIEIPVQMGNWFRYVVDRLERLCPLKYLRVPWAGTKGRVALFDNKRRLVGHEKVANFRSQRRSQSLLETQSVIS